jgi:hypothetical protein
MPLPDKDQVYLIRPAAAKFLPANHFFTISGATLLPSKKMTQKPHSLGILTVLVSATINREFPDASRASVDRPSIGDETIPMHLPANEQCCSASRPRAKRNLGISLLP